MLADRSRYSSSTRIGNWAEDIGMRARAVADFRQAQARGGLLMNKVQRHLQNSLKPSGMSYSRDRMVHFGDHVMLYSVKTEGVLSVDLEERDNGGIEAYGLSTSTLTKGPVSRNVFRIMPPAKDTKTKLGATLRFGEYFSLQTVAELRKQPLWLFTMPKTAMFFSKRTRNQLALVSAIKGGDNSFSVCFRDVTKRFEMRGQPVPANAEVVITHKRTNQALSSDVQEIYNDFGTEYEVCCATSLSTRKKQVLSEEQVGRLTADTPAKGENQCNHWAFLTAADPATEYKIVEQKVDPAAFFAKVRNFINMKKGMRGLAGVKRTFKLFDTDKNGTVEMKEFVKGMESMGFGINDEEAKVVQMYFDKDGDGKISYEEFYLALRGKPNTRREALIQKAFAAMDKNGDGSISIDDLKGVYTARGEPEVKTGKITEDKAMKRFLGNFEHEEKDGIVTFEEWMDYYGGLSALIDSDEYFEFMMKNVWGELLDPKPKKRPGLRA